MALSEMRRRQHDVVPMIKPRRFRFNGRSLVWVWTRHWHFGIGRSWVAEWVRTPNGSHVQFGPFWVTHFKDAWI